MRQLEQEFGIHIFYKDKKELRLTPEGEILVKYARRALAVYRNARQAIEDSRICMSHIGVGITHTVGESCVPQVLAEYCNQTPGVHINIVTDTIKNLYDMMRSYELDVAIVDGQFPASGYTEVLLDTDYLCLVVSPIHPLARRASVAIGALQGERFIMRPKGAGTRSMFESYLSECGADIRDFNIIIEMDSVATIKELVAQDLGISVIAHSACREDEQAGRLAVDYAAGEAGHGAAHQYGASSGFFPSGDPGGAAPSIYRPALSRGRHGKRQRNKRSVRGKSLKKGWRIPFSFEITPRRPAGPVPRRVKAKLFRQAEAGLYDPAF